MTSMVSRFVHPNSDLPQYVQSAVAQPRPQRWRALIRGYRLVWLRPDVMFVVAVSMAWTWMLLCLVLPLLREQNSVACDMITNQVEYTFYILLGTFGWFWAGTFMLMVPCVTRCIARMKTGPTAIGGEYRNSLVTIFWLRDFPLYVFVPVSVWLWVPLLRSPFCYRRWTADLFFTLRLFAAYGNFASLVFVGFAYWHTKLLSDTIDELERSMQTVANALFRRDTAVAIMQELRTCTREEAVTYSDTCAICLGEWEKTDVLKVTPCEHAFHEDCIGKWLNSCRSTCALCRSDLSKPVESSPRPHRTSGAITSAGRALRTITAPQRPALGNASTIASRVSHGTLPGAIDC